MIRFSDFIDVLSEASWFTKGKKQVLDAQIMKILRKSLAETRSPEDKARQREADRKRRDKMWDNVADVYKKQKAAREAERAARKKGK